MLAARSSFLVAALVLAAAVAFMAPHVVSDADALSRLAMARLLVQERALPRSDPFTFAAPEVPFGDPEWLGDLGFYALYAYAGERGLVLGAIALAVAGYVLALRLSITLGARAVTALALMLCTLAAAAPRIAPRNDVHLLWLVPAFAGLACRAPTRRACVLGMAGLAWLWSQLHSSFLLGLPLLAAALWETPRRERRALWALLAVYPVLPWLGLADRSTYDQLFDHLRGASVYVGLLSEWMSPVVSTGVLAILPLYVITLLGALALWAERARVRPVALVLFGVGCLLAYGSRRFLPLLGCMIVPPSAAALDAWLARSQAAVRRRAAWAGLAVVLGYAALTAVTHLRREEASVFASDAAPAPAVRFIAEHAPAGSRIANAFDEGPWLLWIAGYAPGELRHYLDPRNNLGSRVLGRYVYEVLPNPSVFEREAERLRITLAFFPVRGLRTRALLSRLASSPAWRLIYWDGRYVVYAKQVDLNRSLSERFGYRVLRPTLDLRYLSPTVSTSDLDHDLTLLDKQSALHADVIRAYLALRGSDPERARSAAAFLESVWPQLPDSAPLAEALRALSRH